LGPARPCVSPSFRAPLSRTTHAVVCAVVCLWARTVGDGPGRDVVMKQLKSRAGTLNEIIKSEAAYVQYLTVLMEVRVVGRVRVRVVVPLRLTRIGAIGGVERRRSRCPFGRRRCCDWTTSCASLPTSAASCPCTDGSSATSRTATPIGTLPSFLARHFLLRHRTTLTRYSHDTHTTHRPSQPMLGDLFCKYMVRLARRQIGKAGGGGCSAHTPFVLSFFRAKHRNCSTRSTRCTCCPTTRRSSSCTDSRPRPPRPRSCPSSRYRTSPPPEWRGLPSPL
jgi:hypothetical protein